jgi:molecular chaperone GrpE
MGCNPTDAAYTPWRAAIDERMLGRSHTMKFEPKTQPSVTPKPTDSVAPKALELGALQKDLAHQTDLHLRVAADFENFKRRSRQEAEGRAVAQKESFIAELLPVVDNLERALASGSTQDSSPFHQGVAMTLKQLQQLLARHGVESDDIVGKPFDPHRHEALSEGHDPAKPHHAILTVLQRGYRRGDKVVRPAKVEVNDLAALKQGHDGH